MSGVTYSEGMIVSHPKKPEWGLGKVLAVEGVRTVHAVFRHDPERGVRRIRVDHLPLSPVKDQTDPVLAALPSLSAFEKGWKVGDPNHFPLWQAIVTEFENVSDGKYPVTPSDGPFARFMQLHVPQFGTGNIHYEWLLRTTDGQLDVALHVELNDPDKSLEWIEPVRRNAEAIAMGGKHRFVCGPYGEQSAQAAFIIPYRHEDGKEAEVSWTAADLMNRLIERTLQSVIR